MTSEVPWPLDSGGHLRTFHMLARLAHDHEVTLVVPIRAQLPAGADAAFRAANVRLHAVPGAEPGRVGQAFAALRTMARGEPYVMYRRHHRSRVAAAIRQMCDRTHPDVVYFDHLDSFVYEACAGATVVGDLHNVYSTLLQRTASDATSGVWRRYLAREARLLDAAEHRAADRADLLLAVSDSDRRHFERIGRAPVTVAPNGVDCRHYADLPAGRLQDPPVVMFLGAMSWAPNAAAAEFLGLEVLPVLRRRIPGVRLQIVGRDPSDQVRRLAADPDIDVTGAVDDVRPYIAGASVLAVPLTSGGGTRLKILEAFAAGLPVISTPVGCEGIAADHGRHLLVAEPDVFADVLATGLADRERLAGVAVEARALVEGRYDWDAIGTTASAAIVDAHSRRIQVRTAATQAAP